MRQESALQATDWHRRAVGVLILINQNVRHTCYFRLHIWQAERWVRMKHSMPTRHAENLPRSTAGQPSKTVGHRPDPLGFLELAHREQLDICNLLEEIADSLPQRVDRLKCFAAAGRLRVTVRLHQMDEDEGLFPILREKALIGGPLLASLERLESEHVEDEGLSDDVIEGLELLARGRQPRSIDGLAYMLRAFFDAHRRHIHFENEWVLPVARLHLNDDDLAAIENVILKNRSANRAAFFANQACAAAKAGLVPVASPDSDCAPIPWAGST
jgi:hypothetical protein